jgi:predicted transcriptional regulator
MVYWAMIEIEANLTGEIRMMFVPPCWVRLFREQGQGYVRLSKLLCGCLCACAYKCGCTTIGGEVFFIRGLCLLSYWTFSDYSRKDWRLVMQLGITRRSIQVMADILSLCKQPQTERQLIGKTSLSRNMVRVYLSQLQSKRLLEVHHSTTKYATTREGFRFSERYAEVLEL